MRKLIFILLVFISVNSSAQDVHFAQSTFVPQLINPASIGVFNGWERVTISNRKQWIGIDKSYMSSQFSFDMNLLKNDNGKQNSYLGLGLSFFNDIAGEGQFGINQLNFSVSGIIPIAENQTVSAAIQLGGVQRTGKLSNLNWGNQFDGTDFNSNINSNESNTNSSFFHEDFGAGIFYNFNGQKSALTRNELSNIYAGASYFHVTQPKLKFSNGNQDKLDAKFVLHTGAQFDIPNTEWASSASLVYMNQGPHQMLLINAMIKARLRNGTKYTGIYSESYFGFGLIHRVKDAIAPQVMVEFGSCKIGLLYELSVSQLSQANKGGFEISFQWANARNALFKSRGSKGFIKTKNL
jgi:type IX secretion system PorP/SprF family membrane protein